MKIERIHYRCWPDAYRCTAEGAELVLVASMGPRILSLRRHGGANLLHEDATDFGVGDWRLYGGHRFTVAPEGIESYWPDNARCTVEISDWQLRVVAPPGSNDVCRALVISAADDGEGFDVRHVLENNGSRPWRGALWAITCVPCAKVVAPCVDGRIRFWPETNPSDWTFAPDHIAAMPAGRRGKIGWHSDAGWLASLQRDTAFVIHTPDPAPVHACVDDGCNLEIFMCAGYMELETLGGEVVLAPGDHASHFQRWRLLDSCFAGRQVAAIAAQARCGPILIPARYAS